MEGALRSALVLGGAGIVGSHLARELHVQGCAVTVVDVRKPEGFHAHLLADLRSEAVVAADIGAPGVLDGVLAKVQPEAVFNLVAAMQAECNRSVLNGVHVNVHLAGLVLERTFARDVPKVVTLSSRDVYGPPHLRPGGIAFPARPFDVAMPVASYGRMKWLVESMVEEFWRRSAGRYCAVRTATQWGITESIPGTRAFSLYNSILTAGLKNKPFSFATGGETGTDLISNLGLARALVAAGNPNRPFSQHVYNVGSARTYKTTDLAAALHEVTGWSKYNFDPATPIDPKKLSSTHGFQLDIADSMLDWDWRPIRDMTPDVATYSQLWNAWKQ